MHNFGNSVMNSQIMGGSSVRLKSRNQEEGKYTDVEGIEYIERVSNHRPTIGYGGNFAIDTNIYPTSVYGSPRGKLIKMHYVKLNPMRVCGDRDHNPEVVIIEGEQGTGKTNVVYHFIENAIKSNPKFPVIFFGKAYDVNLGMGWYNSMKRVDGNSDGRERDYKYKWTDLKKRTYFNPSIHPFVKTLAPPYKGPNVIDRCDEPFYFNPKNANLPLLQTYTMMISSSSEAYEGSEPKYMQPARELVTFIKEGHNKRECLNWVDKNKEKYTYFHDRNALEKVRGGVNDLFDKGLRSDAPTMEERILEKDPSGFPVCMVVDFEQHTPKTDNRFGNAIAQAISDVCELNLENMGFVPPLLIIDESVRFVAFPGEITEYIKEKRFVRAGVILLCHDVNEIASVIIKREGPVSDFKFKGMWTHYFRCYEDFTCTYICKMQKEVRDFTRESDPVQRERNKLEYNINPPYLKLNSWVMPSNILVSQ